MAKAISGHSASKSSMAMATVAFRVAPSMVSGYVCASNVTNFCIDSA